MLPDSPTPLAAKLTQIARRMTAARVATGTAWWLAGIGGTVLGLFLVDNLLHLPAALRLVAALVVAGWACYGAWHHIVAPMLKPLSAQAVAVLSEQHASQPDNRLINAVQFESMHLAADQRILAAGTMRRAAEQLATLPIANLIRAKQLLAWSGGALLALALWSWYGAAFPEHAANALHRFVAPLGDVPALGSVIVDLEPSGTLTVAEGRDLTITVRVRGLHGTSVSEPPSVRWAEGRPTIPADTTSEGAGGTERLPLRHEGDGWIGLLPAVRRNLALRAFCGDGCSPGLTITVRPRPVLSASTWIVTPPAYIGTAPERRPGPPASLTVLPGTTAAIELTTTPDIDGLMWQCGAQQLSAKLSATRDAQRWLARTMITAESAGPFQLFGTWAEGRGELASGTIALDTDRSPEVSLSIADDQRTIVPGATLITTLVANDDHGLQNLELTARDVADGAPWSLKRWSYLGPPGIPEDRQRLPVICAPGQFQPGHAYVIEARARDWCPDGKPGQAKPIIIRVRSIDDLTAPSPEEAPAIAALKLAISRQREAVGLADNLSTQLSEALAHHRLDQHRDAIGKKQTEAQSAGRTARERFASLGDSSTAAALTPLVDGEMGLVATGLAALSTVSATKAPAAVAAIHDRQTYILDHLIALLGEAVARDQSKPKVAIGADGLKQQATTSEAVRQLNADLDEFIKRQERVIEKSRSLLDKTLTDLSDEKDKVLGDLAREEAALAKFAQEKLNDFAKLPKQDFADSSMASQFNAVFQEMSQADAALYAKRVELAVPHEQSGLELAKTLEQNLEKWLASNPDNTQWKMEEPTATPDVPLAELPKQLEDIVGDLVDQEDKMSADIEDASSSWMDSIDKGAGWGTGDGPISNMSAKGVTGNQLPNKNEVGGRSGEGRTGRSSGQMVENEAWGKKGRETPTRMSPGAFESGSVKDHSTEPTGGASGGGKLSGADQEGLRGPVPPALKDAMQRLAGQQARIKQQAGELALQLRARHTPNGNLETAVQSMQAIEDAAKRNDGGSIRQRYSDAVTALKDTKRQLTISGVGSERIKLDHTQRDGQTQGASERIPPGYEDMAASYFQRLAQDRPTR